MRTCELVDLHGGDPVVVGSIILDGVDVTSHPADSRLVNEILGEPMIVEGGKRQVTLKDAPEEWFNALPLNFHGSYFWARIVGKTVKLAGGQVDQAPTDDSTLKAADVTGFQDGSDGTVEKFSDDQPRVPAGGPGGGEFAGGGNAGGTTVQFVPSERVQRAIASKVHTGKAEQHVADESERVLSEAIGIPRTGDNSAFDVRNDEVAIECKCFTTNSNDKLTINKTALGRKLAEQRAEGLKVYTVVVDRRSGWKAGNPMGHATYYVKQGVGSFHLGSMTKVTLPQLKEMVHG